MGQSLTQPNTPYEDMNTGQRFGEVAAWGAIEFVGILLILMCVVIILLMLRWGISAAKPRTTDIAAVVRGVNV